MFQNQASPKLTILFPNIFQNVALLPMSVLWNESSGSQQALFNVTHGKMDRFQAFISARFDQHIQPWNQQAHRGTGYLLTHLKVLHGAFQAPIRDFPAGPVVKNAPSNARDRGSIPGGRTKMPRAAEQSRPRSTTPEPACRSQTERASRGRPFLTQQGQHMRRRSPSTAK